MAGTIMHCFDEDQAEAEGTIIGSLLAGYGELELEMAACLIAATDNFDGSIRSLFKTRGEEKRINTADTAMKTAFVAAGISFPYTQTIEDMHWCRRIRNQYAHCQWFYDQNSRQLCFVDLEAIAKLNVPIGPLESYKRPINVQILTLQMEFFVYVRHSFWYLADHCRRYMLLQRDPAAVLFSPVFSMPPAVA